MAQGTDASGQEGARGKGEASDSPPLTPLTMRLEPDQSMVFLQQLRRKKIVCAEEIKVLKEQLHAPDEEIDAERQRLGMDDAEAKRKALLEQGVSRFNEKAKAGVQFLKENNYFHDDGTCTPEDIAHFLKTSDCSKKAVGEYLGENKPENLQVAAQHTHANKHSRSLTHTQTNKHSLTHKKAHSPAHSLACAVHCVGLTPRCWRHL